jgi:cobalt transporter subunit CbtB
MKESAMLTTEARIHSISASERPLPRAEVLVTAGIVALLGIIILYGVGFAAPDLIHSAAHDTRHSISVPCH